VHTFTCFHCLCNTCNCWTKNNIYLLRYFEHSETLMSAVLYLCLHCLSSELLVHVAVFSWVRTQIWIALSQWSRPPLVSLNSWLWWLQLLHCSENWWLKAQTQDTKGHMGTKHDKRCTFGVHVMGRGSGGMSIPSWRYWSCYVEVRTCTIIKTVIVPRY
jgi:hypothetical protein